ncbi:MAG TPA: sulfatase-like hydrolase/transferase, partial [Nocardioidaceae bacterium]|nr:sulfatase-like hydrolase/transferase [Nocardioidaceae bacterium]
MRRNRQRAVTLGVTALAVSLTGSLLSDATATPTSASSGPGTSSPPSEKSAPAVDGRRKRLRAMHATTSKSAAQRPNIVVLMTDDMRADDLGKPWMRRTSRLIGNQGATFTNAFAPTPLCAPARASFLTGKYVHNHGVRNVREPYGFRALRDRNTLPVWLYRAGYNTIFLGKYINGYGRQKTRNGTPSRNYIPPGWTEWRASLDGRGTYN